MDSIRHKTARGMRWTATEMVAQQAIRFGIMVVLVRLLAPSSFGLIEMAMTGIGLLTVLRDIGIGEAIVQSRDVDDRFLSTVHWLCVLLGAALTAAGIACAGLVALFYDEPRLVWVVRYLAVIFLVDSLGMVPISMLRREMRFRALSIVSIISVAIRGVVGISLAVAGRGVWALVAMELAGSAVMLLGVRVVFRWRPLLVMSPSGVSRALRFGAGLTGFGIFNYFARTADSVLIGRFLGTEALGYYSRAYWLMQLPVSRLGAVIGRTMFPALSRLQGQAERLKQAYLREVAAIGTLSFPMMFGLFATAHVFVPVVLGEQWLPVVPLLRILCLAGALEAVGTTVGQLYLVKARTGLLFAWRVVSGTLRVVAFIIGLRWGAFGVACAYLIVVTSLMPLGVWLAIRLIGLRLGELLGALVVSFQNAAIMLGIVGLLSLGMVHLGVDVTWNLVASVLAGCVSYSWLVWLRRPRAVADMLAVVPLHRLPLVGGAIAARFGVTAAPGLRSALRRVDWLKALWDRAKRARFRRRHQAWRGQRKILLLLTPPPSLTNLGDHAQAVAVHRWLKQHRPDLPVWELDKTEVGDHLPAIQEFTGPDDLVLLHSGGNMSDHTPWTEGLRRLCVEAFPDNRVVSLQQTIYFSHTPEGREQLAISARIYRAHPRLTIVARDRVSRDLAEQHFAGCQVLCCPDFVLSLTPPLPERVERHGAVVCLRSDYESSLREDERAALLHAVEAMGHAVTPFSTVLDHDIPRDRREETFEGVVDLFARHTVMVTDRLHALIFSVLARTPVVALPTSDHKIDTLLEWLADIGSVTLARDIDEAETLVRDALASPTIGDEGDWREHFDRLAREVLDAD